MAIASQVIAAVDGPLRHLHRKGTSRRFTGILATSNGTTSINGSVTSASQLGVVLGGTGNGKILNNNGMIYPARPASRRTARQSPMPA